MAEIPIVYEHTCRGTYFRRFDHDEAVARMAAGERVADLAEEYGVTPGALYHARRRLDPMAKAHDTALRQAARTTRCEMCGAPAMKLVGGKAKNNHDGRVVCRECRTELRTERLRWKDGILVAVRCNILDCANGERWQHPDEFPRGSRHLRARPGGIHGMCRSCSTRSRKQYRERKKIPCVQCGAPCLPASEKGSRGKDTGLCLTCYVGSEQHRESQRRAAVTRAHRAGP